MRELHGGGGARLWDSVSRDEMLTDRHVVVRELWPSMG